MLQRLQPNDKPKRKEVADNMLHRISEDKEFLKRICFSDEETFHLSGKLNKHNVRIWGSEHPHEIRVYPDNCPNGHHPERWWCHLGWCPFGMVSIRDFVQDPD